LEVTVGGLQLSSTSQSEVVEQSETTMVLNSEVQFYPEGRLGLDGVGAQGSPNHFCVGVNSHKSCMDQGDRWVIKPRSGLNLFDLIKLWTQRGLWRREWDGDEVKSC